MYQKALRAKLVLSHLYKIVAVVRNAQKGGTMYLLSGFSRLSAKERRQVIGYLMALNVSFSLFHLQCEGSRHEYVCGLTDYGVGLALSGRFRLNLQAELGLEDFQQFYAEGKEQ